MTRDMETINISKASTTTNLFYLFFHGGKAAIIPFLTLFLRLVGLTALEVGIIIAVKTVTSLIWAPLWAKCATAYSRHRCVLILSLFMMILTYLSFPTLYTQLSRPEHCFVVSSSNNSVDLPHYPPDHALSTASTEKPKFSDFFTTSVQEVSTLTTIKPSSVSTVQDTTEKETTPQPNIPEKTTVQEGTSSSKISQAGLSTESPIKDIRPEVFDTYKTMLKEYGFTEKKFIENLTAHDLYELLNMNYPSLKVTEDEVSQLHKLTKLQADESSQNKVKKRSPEDQSATQNDWRNQIKDKLHTIQSSLQSDNLLLFLVLLAIVVGGEIFASPVEKVADDSWFDFLNRIDDLERYGQQRFFGSLAFVIIPIAVTISVDYTPCFILPNIHHFLLHFCAFAVLTSAALIVACCYPVPPPSGGKYTSKICKALKIICYDGQGFLFSVTLLLSGMVYASYHNFLFWRIQDLGGKEIPMGLCVSIGAFAEIPMLILSNRLVKKLGHTWMVSVSLFILSLRVLYYAFIPEPWAFLPMELTHGITHTALWFAILSYDDFNIGAAIDRSLRSILSSFYFGIGFSAGSIASGYIYHNYGSSVLFWGCSAVTGGWCLLFSVIQKCIPKKEKVRYIKLLRSDSDNSDEEEDDWLEMALKGH